MIKIEYKVTNIGEHVDILVVEVLKTVIKAIRKWENLDIGDRPCTDRDTYISWALKNSNDVEGCKSVVINRHRIDVESAFREGRQFEADPASMISST